MISHNADIYSVLLGLHALPIILNLMIILIIFVKASQHSLFTSPLIFRSLSSRYCSQHRLLKYTSLLFYPKGERRLFANACRGSQLQETRSYDKFRHQRQVDARSSVCTVLNRCNTGFEFRSENGTARVVL